jgi:glycosyltransferase involved in cell wall biosynthesis
MRLPQAVRIARQELRTLRRASQSTGGRDALVARARHLLGVDDLEARARLLAEEITATRTVFSDVQEDTEARLLARIDAVDRRDAEVDRRALVGPVTEWVRHAALQSSPLISVVLATRDRATLLARAVASVRAQVYPHWELVVVDHASTDGTASLLAELAATDDRIVVVREEHGTVGTARNRGLSAAHGALVTYVDDDNVMEPLWLKAVAWAAERRPDVEVLYGARLTDVEWSEHGPVGWPYLHFEAFDRTRLEADNFIDLGVIAHRRNLPEAIFDENLEAMVDWDLLLRMTRTREPMALPVVASLYSTTAPNRISHSRHPVPSAAAVQAKLNSDRPLRVLAYNSLFPLVPETYIGAEMRALTDNGAQLAWCMDHWTPSPVRVDEPMYTDLDTAVVEFDPDLLFLFWATFADARLDTLSRLGRPFAVRVHSFDFDMETVERIRSHPLCVGMWAYPHHARFIDGAHELVPILSERESFPAPAAERSIILSASAGLPKKDWPTLVGAFAELARAGVDCRIVVGRTQSHEDEPDLIRRFILEARAPVMLSVDVPHDQVIDLLGRTAAVVYSKVPGGPFGMPRSIIEGMYAGTSVIMPDRPEASFTGGPQVRTYRRSADIVRHATEILRGGPVVDAERRANRRFVEDRFADPALGAAFLAQLQKALLGWRAR